MAEIVLGFQLLLAMILYQMQQKLSLKRETLPLRLWSYLGSKNENDLKQEILEETGEVVDYIDWESFIG